MTEPLGYLSDEEARREGFTGASGFIWTWEAINGGYDPDAIVWRVVFEVDASETEAAA
jgi:hypothetical protein